MEERLKELGLTEEQITAVTQIVTEAENSAVSKAVEEKVTELTETHSTELEKLREEMKSKDVDYAARDIIGKHKFTSELAREMALQKLKEQNFELKDGVLEGADDFMEKMKGDNASAFESGEAKVSYPAGGGSAAAGANTSGVEAAFYGINPGLK